MIHTAVVRWLSAKARGRAGLPPTLRYVGISRFPDDSDEWPDGAWSVELRFKQPPPEQGRQDISEAMLRFLMDEAPHQRLHKGACFGLYEGVQKVADVDVLD